MKTYTCEWDDMDWWFIYKEGKVFLPIEGNHEDKRAELITEALNNNIDLEDRCNSYLNMLIEKDEIITKLKTEIGELESTKEVIIQQNDGELLEGFGKS